MPEIDGRYKLGELESALLLKEAAGNALTGLNNNDKDEDPRTVATFDRLKPGKRPKPLILRASADLPPSGTTLICSGIVYVESKKSDVSAYRVG